MPTRLSVVTVVFNDAPGLRRTIETVRRLLPQIEYWIIDGSTNGDVREVVVSLADDRINLLSEPDDGLYYAMNKGRDLVTGDYLLFLNAGDVFVPTFDPERFLADGEGRVVIGFSAERYASDRFLRPARRRAADALTSPPHQATAYPREVYTQLAFDTWMPIKADGDLTRRAIELVGAVVVGELVPEFGLGGRSSSYGDWRLVSQRIRDAGSGREVAKLSAKTALWAVLPHRWFYRLLAWRKYESLVGEPQLRRGVLAERDAGSVMR